MILLFMLVTLEIIALTLGMGLGYNVLVCTLTNRLINWTVLVSSGVLGLLLGLLCAWWACQIFKPAPRLQMVSLITLATAILSDLPAFLFQSKESDQLWMVISLVFCLGTLPGLGLSRLFSLILTPQPVFAPPLKRLDPSVPKVENNAQSLIDKENDFVRRVSIEQKYVEELQQRNHPSKEKDIYFFDIIARLGGVYTIHFNLITPLGKSEFFISCSTNYPRQRPDQVLIVLVTPDNKEHTDEYDGPFFENWNDQTNMSDLAHKALLRMERKLLEAKI